MIRHQVTTIISRSWEDVNEYNVSIAFQLTGILGTDHNPFMKDQVHLKNLLVID